MPRHTAKLAHGRGAMVLMMGLCDAVLLRGGGGGLGGTICTRGASGPVRYNPVTSTPGDGSERQALRRGNKEDVGLKKSRPLRRWKRASETEEGSGAGREDEVGGGVEEGFAIAEIRRLKSELKWKEGSAKSVPSFSSRVQLEKEVPLGRVEEDKELLADDELAASHSSSLPCRQEVEVPSRVLVSTSEMAPVGHTSTVKKSYVGSGLRHGDGRKYEGLPSEILDMGTNGMVPAENDLSKGLGMIYGDGQKFEGLFSNPYGEFLANGDKFSISVPAERENKEIAQEKSAAKSYALRLLGIAPQTAQKLRQKLTSRSISSSVIESTIADLQRCGLQSDAEYAEVFARSRWRSSIWGPQRLKQELRQRGVCPDDIERALQKVFTSCDILDQDVNKEEEEGRWGMTKEASDHLLEKATRQWRRGGNISDEARKRRMIGWLQRRGFNWSITSQVLKTLESRD